MVKVHASGILRRSTESRAVHDFLSSTERQPTGLIVEGEAGIGKTTIWLETIDQARDRGFRVLSARVGQAESVLAYAALADLLSAVDPETIAGLPDVQRLAIDRVLLRAGGDGPATDQHAVAAAFAAVLRFMSEDAPLLVAIDDVQWLDPSSKAVLAFAARRLDSRIGVLATERCDPDCGDAMTWLQLARPGGIERIRVGHLSLGGLHALISARLGRTFPRPTMVRIAEISGGNPFYALELAHAMHAGSTRAQPHLPSTLAELMRLRIGSLDGPAGDALLAAACMANPTVEMLSDVLGMSADDTADLLDEAEVKGILAIDGNSVRFSHPLLAQSVYTEAKPARRRAMHRRLSETVVLPELKARHMALASASADAETLKALDNAADVARDRGAPAAAAELLELAISLGGDSASRRVRAAKYHFKAGDAERAGVLLDQTIGELKPGPLRGTALSLRAAIHLYDDDYSRGASLLRQAMSDADSTPALKAHILMSLAITDVIAGEFENSLARAREAVEIAEESDSPLLQSQALAHFVNMHFQSGRGLDEKCLQRALDLENARDDAPTAFSASTINALSNALTGQLNVARRQMAAVRERCVERGAETDLTTMTGYSTLIEIWRGCFAEAAALAEDTVERAQQVGGPRAIALAARALVAAYAGREQDARADANDALRIVEQCRTPRLGELATTALGLLEVSLGRHKEALAVLRPLLDRYPMVPSTEILNATFVPDAVEALVALGRYDEAEPLIDKLERNGEALNRHWMLAISARCRAMVQAARGDIAAADRSIRSALAEHEKLAMPFELARTQLLAGQLERRQRQKEAATTMLREALAAFERMGAALWADRARAELARVNVSPTRDMSLTQTERRVAELAAEGNTNRDIASALFVSPKTVEAHLARIYRKLKINSRAELGRIIGNQG